MSAPSRPLWQTIIYLPSTQQTYLSEMPPVQAGDIKGSFQIQAIQSDGSIVRVNFYSAFLSTYGMFNPIS